MESKEETPKVETPKEETPKEESPKEDETTAGAPPEITKEGPPSKDYNLKGTDKQKYIIKIIKGEKSIIFNAKIENDIGNILYTEETDFEEFSNLNRFFRQYDSVEELFTDLFQTLEEKEMVICKKANNVKFSILVEARGKQEEVAFILKPDKPNTEDITFNLCDKVKELEEKLNEKEKAIEDLKEEIKDLRNDMIKESNENSKVEKEMKDLLHQVRKGIAIGSQIIRYDEFNFIESAVRKTMNKNVKFFNLLYRGSRNGFRAQDFHEKCDGKKNTITVVLTRNGRRFGGFTHAKWDKSNGYKTDEKGFLFSLDSKEVYANKKDNYGIYCYNDKGPSFGGGHDLFIDDNCNKDNESYDNSNHSYETYGKKYALAGTKYFYVEDYEVYELDLE